MPLSVGVVVGVKSIDATVFYFRDAQLVKRCLHSFGKVIAHLASLCVKESCLAFRNVIDKILLNLKVLNSQMRPEKGRKIAQRDIDMDKYAKSLKNSAK